MARLNISDSHPEKGSMKAALAERNLQGSRTEQGLGVDLGSITDRNLLALMQDLREKTGASFMLVSGDITRDDSAETIAKLEKEAVQ